MQPIQTSSQVMRWHLAKSATVVSRKSFIVGLEGWSSSSTGSAAAAQPAVALTAAQPAVGRSTAPAASRAMLPKMSPTRNSAMW